MVEIKYSGDELWARIERAVEKVKQRLQRVVEALDAAGIPHAVIGGNAVQLWVAQVDEAAVRNTRDVDIVINRADLDAVKQILSAIGFHFAEVQGIPMFLDGPTATPRDAIHIVYAGEKVRPEHLAAPAIDDCERIKSIRTLHLRDLVRMKLVNHRLKDRVHLQDMISVGLIDQSWLDFYPPELRQRLKDLLDNPDG